MNITITRQELLELWHGLPALSDLKGFKLGYAVARTKAKLKVEIGALEEALKPDKVFQEYEEKRLALCQKHVQKDGQGNPLTQGGQFVFGENREVFDATMAPLQEEYAGAIEDRKQQVEGYLASMKEAIAVEIHHVSEDDLKDQEPTVAQMQVLYHLIKE